MSRCATRHIANVLAAAGEDPDRLDLEKAEPARALRRAGRSWPGEARRAASTARRTAMWRASASMAACRAAMPGRLNPSHGRLCTQNAPARPAISWTFWHAKSDTGLAPIPTCCAGNSGHRWDCRRKTIKRLACPGRLITVNRTQAGKSKVYGPSPRRDTGERPWLCNTIAHTKDKWFSE